MSLPSSSHADLLELLGRFITTDYLVEPTRFVECHLNLREWLRTNSGDAVQALREEGVMFYEARTLFSRLSDVSEGCGQIIAGGWPDDSIVSNDDEDLIQRFNASAQELDSHMTTVQIVRDRLLQNWSSVANDNGLDNKTVVSVCIDQNTVSIDGGSFNVEPLHAKMLDAMLSAARSGDWWLSSSIMIQSLTGCKGKHVSR